jgi:serine/threonine protein kinase/N-acetylglutamate synthase-like GNAT family acetyltransferase
MYICLVMEYCDGGDLNTYIIRQWNSSVKKNQPIREKTIINYLMQIANGLNYLHENGMVHRDLKPSNVLITKDNILKIADFGTIKQFQCDESYKAYTLCGTPDYIAIEVLLNEPYNEKIDIYSLGMILMNMLCGKTCVLSKQWKNQNGSVSSTPKVSHDNPNIGLVEFFEEMRAQICEQYGYSMSIFSLMKRLLSFNPEERPSAFECIQILKEMLHSNEKLNDRHIHSFSTSIPLESLDLLKNQIKSDHLKVYILTFLDLHSLYRMMLVSRYWYHLCQNGALWKIFCERILGKPVLQTVSKETRNDTIKKLNAVRITNENEKATNSYKSYLRNYFIHRRQALALRKKSTLGKKLVHEMLPDQAEQCTIVLAHSFSKHAIVRKLFNLDSENYQAPIHFQRHKSSITTPDVQSSIETKIQNVSIINEMNEQLISRVNEETFFSIFTKFRDKEIPVLTTKQRELLILVMREFVNVAVNHGRLWVLTNYDLYNQSAVQAVAVWQHPKSETTSYWLEVKKRLKSIKMYSKVLQYSGIKGAYRLFRALDVLHQTHVQVLSLVSSQKISSGHFWHLYAMGVMPDMIDNGFGSLVLQPILRTANENGLPCFTGVVDAANVSFFLRHGFMLVEHQCIKGHNKNSVYLLKRSDDIYVNYN